MDRVGNKEVRRRPGIQSELLSRVDRRVLRWFGHLEKMNEYRMSIRVLMVIATDDDMVQGGCATMHDR